jgi:hypothetical protein
MVQTAEPHPQGLFPIFSESLDPPEPPQWKLPSAASALRLFTYAGVAIGLLSAGYIAALISVLAGIGVALATIHSAVVYFTLSAIAESSAASALWAKDQADSLRRIADRGRSLAPGQREAAAS